MPQWYFTYGDQRQGPFDDSQARARASANPNGYAWREGFAEWLPIRQVAELRGAAPATGSPPPIARGHRPDRLPDLRRGHAVRRG
jgi:hypothetical protein